MDEPDPLLQVLGDFGMTGLFYSTSELNEPWGIDLPPLHRMVVFHLMTEGRAVVAVDGDLHPLATGDLMLVPHGAGHRILSNRGAPAIGLWDAPRIEETDHYERLRIDGGGPPARLVCGAVAFSDPAMARVLASLPPVLTAGRGPEGEWLRSCFDAIARETQHPRSGSDVITARLADVLLVHAIRDWLATEVPEIGWLAAVRDPILGPALRAFHDKPGQRWTLAALAAEAHISRSGFAARFTELVGESPMAYVASWRMGLAGAMLRDPDAVISSVARQVGYDSEPAFTRAFRRHHGVTPGAWRRGDGTVDWAKLVQATRAS